MNFGRVMYYKDFPAAFVASQAAQRASYLAAHPDAVLPPLRVGIGQLIPIEDQSSRYAFYEPGFQSGNLIAYDLQNGDFTTRIVALQRVIAGTYTAVVKARAQQELDQMLIDQAAGRFPQFAANLRRALAVPFIANLIINRWRYQEWDDALAAKVASACVICGASNPNTP